LDGWKDSLKGVVIGALTGIAFGLVGFVMAEIPGTHAMGSVMFLLVPFAAGFAIAVVTRGQWQVCAAAILATLGALALLIAMRLETPLCAVLALPLLFTGLLIGILIGIGYRRLTGRPRGNHVTLASFAFLAMPLLIFAGHRAEISALIHPRQELVTSTIRLAASPDQVWADLRSFDSLGGKKPFLMYIGLPIPVRCVTQGSGEGSKRTCYFNHGYIEETVTEWSPPNRMRLSIDRTNMPGRHWLGFETAEYDLRPDGGGTVLTRITTIISNLYPAWYWRPFERWGVASEHEYIFRDLVLRTVQPASGNH
jgi:hypothetical protein